MRRTSTGAIRLLLLVDQFEFEEVLTQAEHEAQTRFIAALQAPRSPEHCALILTLRGVFEDAVEAVERGQAIHVVG